MTEEGTTLGLDFGTVVQEQLRAVGLAVRREVVVAAVLLFGPLLLIILVEAYPRESAHYWALDPGAGLGLFTAFLGMVAPTVVWRGEEPFGNSLLWLLPVDHRRHMIAKVMAGWIWLVGVISLGLLVCALLAKVTGGSAGVQGTRLLLLDRAAVESGTGAGLQEVHWITPFWQWLAPLAAGSATYLLFSGFHLGLRRPWFWVLGLPALFFLLAFVAYGAEIRWLDRAVQGVFDQIVPGPLGFDSVATGGWEGLRTVVWLPSGESFRAWREMPSVGRWLPASLLWNGLGLVALAAALARPRDH